MSEIIKSGAKEASVEQVARGVVASVEQVEIKSNYGNCEGPESMYVKLISSDGHEFTIKRSEAIISRTMKAMLSGPGEFCESETNYIRFCEIPSHVLQMVCLYLHYKARYNNCTTEIPEFHVAPEMGVELLLAGNFLDC